MSFFKQLFGAKEIKIGTQIWLNKNLNVDHYRNGDPIPEVSDFNEWGRLTTGAFCYFSNESKYGKIWGKIYNGFAICDSRGLAPEGWHVPSEKEWKILFDYLGGEEVACSKMIETGTKHSGSSKTGVTNESGFTALEGGLRFDDGYFECAEDATGYWSSTEYHSTEMCFWVLYRKYLSISRFIDDKKNGSYVRCIKD